jgi:hypothetical protein
MAKNVFGEEDLRLFNKAEFVFDIIWKKKIGLFLGLFFSCQIQLYERVFGKFQNEL